MYTIRGGILAIDYHTWSGRGEMFYNIHNPKFILTWGILILPLLLYSLKSFKMKPEFLKINFLTVIPVFYVIIFLLVARLEEIDKALTMFLFLIPLALFTLVPSHVKQNHLN